MPARHLVRGALAASVSVALLVSLHGPAARATPSATDDPPWTPRKTKPVPVKKVESLPRPADPAEAAAVRSVPNVMWPQPGVADVALSSRMAQVGSLPLAVGRTPTSPAKVRIELLGRDADRLLLKVNRSDGVSKPGLVSLQVDYRSFRHAYGGDWGSRLRLVRLSDGVPVATRNNGAGVLSAVVPASATPTGYAVQAGPSGGTGDQTATSMAPSVSWSVGGSSGDFNWSYRMDAPPSLGGPGPEVSLGYSSGSVDGRTSSTNNQTSWAGEGFELSPGGTIERRYKSCSADKKDGNNATRDTGDLCWGTDNATFSLNGKGGELVLDDATKTWRPRLDDGSKVERFSGAENGDNDGEYWVITSKDGTRYFFGLNKLPGAAAQRTNSAWTVPVFGNHGGEPCHAPGNFAGSSCDQVYRWNLDYAVDRHGNTMSLFYDTEINRYARNMTPTTVSRYVRSGNIRRIEYGQRDGQVFSTLPVARVQFEPAERCISPTQCSTSQPSTYPDTPLDLACDSDTNCPNKFNPTFWTQRRLAKVTTEIARGATFAPVSTWTLRHFFTDPGDTTPRLWLEAVTHAGHVGQAVAMPEVNFDGVTMPNRVDPVGDGMPGMNWWRVNAIQYGTGGRLAIEYTGADCKPGDVPAPDTNGRRCHPMKWTPPGQTTERTDWFHKYVVSKVTEADQFSGSEPVVTTVEYPSPPAWRHDDEDGLVEIGRKTWSQWRGYDLVIVKKGHPDAATRTVSEHRFFRGMDGDKTATPNVFKDVKIKDSTGVEVDDVNMLAGQERESRKLVGGLPVDRAITDMWQSAATAKRVRPWGTTESFQVQQAGVRQSEAIPGGWRNSTAKHDYSPTGALTQVSDLNDLSTTTDDTCTRFEYAANPSLGIAEMTKRKWTVSVACDKPWVKENVIADAKLTYDDGVTVTKGDVTKRERVKEFAPDGTPIYQTVETATYDPIGRKKSATDADQKTTSISYTPAGNQPATKTDVTKPNGHVTTTELEPAWGHEKAVIDPAGRRTDMVRDAVGRVTKVWQPGRDRNAEPNVQHSYLVQGNGPGVTTTRTLQADGSFEETYTFTDGLMRKRQTQKSAPGGGSLITDLRYDSRGLLVAENGEFYSDLPPSDALVTPDEAQLPAQKLTVYDSVDRPTDQIFRSLDTEMWRTKLSHSADRQTADPPTGEQATTKFTNVQGKQTELRQYTGPNPVGAFDKTTYSYTPRGELETVTDPAGNVWRYKYDVRGRKIQDEDPDKGITTYAYNDLDQVTSSTDARGITLTYGYDEIGRRKTLHEGTTLRAEWTYDTIAKGSPSTATRYANGQAYVTRVTGYDTGGRPAGTEVSVPAIGGAPAKTYPTTYTYTPDGQLDTTTVPAAADLPAETLKQTYTANNLPKALSSELGSYVTNTTYTAFREPETVTLMQTGGKWVQQNNEYETGTRRLSRVVTERQTLPRRIADVGYTYDPGGNITKITDAPSSTSGQPTDTQCFSYDELRRLTEAWTPGDGDCAAAKSAAALGGGPAPYWHQWTLDVTGNRKTEKRTTPTGVTTTSTYDYLAGKPHAVSKVTISGDGADKVNEFAYDAVGNLRNRTLAGVNETLTWNPEGRLEKVSKPGQETSFVYDADGNRLLRKDNTGTTLYIGQTEVLIKPDGTQVGTRHYQHGQQTVAVRTGGKVSWLGMDHHGTPTIVVDAATQSFERRRTTPYGEARGPLPAAWPGQRDFVGGTKDPSTGLVHLGAREYDPTTGRFISVDPVMDPGDPQQLNPYTYANNNPTSFSDADGQRWMPYWVMEQVIQIKVITQRIVEHQRVLVTLHVKLFVMVAVFFFSFIFGWLSLAQRIMIDIVKTVVQIKEVVRTIKTLVKEVLKIKKKIMKWVDDPTPIPNLVGEGTCTTYDDCRRQAYLAYTEQGTRGQDRWRTAMEIHAHENPFEFDFSTDGCSQVSSGYLFESCHRHDFGYRNAERVGLKNEGNRKRVDHTFRDDAHRACRDRAPSCGLRAFLYSSAVRVLSCWDDSCRPSQAERDAREMQGKFGPR